MINETKLRELDLDIHSWSEGHKRETAYALFHALVESYKEINALQKALIQMEDEKLELEEEVIPRLQQKIDDLEFPPEPDEDI